MIMRKNLLCSNFDDDTLFNHEWSTVQREIRTKLRDAAAGYWIVLLVSLTFQTWWNRIIMYIHVHVVL